MKSMIRLIVGPRSNLFNSTEKLKMNAPQDFRLMTSESIGKSILQALVTEIKLLQEPWPKLSKEKQDFVIDWPVSCLLSKKESVLVAGSRLAKIITSITSNRSQKAAHMKIGIFSC